MIIHNDDPTGVSAINLERALGSQEVSDASAAPSAPKESTPVPVDDRIALSIATRLMQQAGQAGEEARLDRILQLKTAIETNQYSVDPIKVGHALIEAELLGL